MSLSHMMLTKIEILKTQIESEFALVTQYRTALRIEKDVNVFLMSWIAMNTKTDPIELVGKYRLGKAALNSIPTRDDPNRTYEIENEE